MLSNNKLIAALLAIMVLAIYFNALNCGFVLDDAALVVHNPFIKSTQLLPKIFQLDSYRHWLGELPYNLMYRPVQALSYFLDFQAWGGLNPSGFHFTNILIHVLNSILVYFILAGILADRKVPAIAAAFFALHPAQVSVVTYISARADLLSSLFMLSSVLLFLKYVDLKKTFLYLLSLFCAGLALLSRENALSFCFFVLLILFLRKKNFKAYFLVVPFLILDLFYILLRAFLFGYPGILTHPYHLPVIPRLLNFTAVVFEYIKVLVIPFNMHLFRSTPFVQGIFELKLVFGMLLLLGMVMAIIVLHKKIVPVFCVIWFLVGLLPVYVYFDGFPNFKQAMMAESWLYLAGIGYFCALAYILLRLKRAGIILALALIVSYAAFTINYNKIWTNNITLDEVTFKYISQDNPMRKVLIDDYIEAGLYNQALQEIGRMKQFYTDTPLVNIAMGNYYLALNRPQDAIDYYNSAVSKSFYTCYKLSLAYTRLGNKKEAEKYSFLSFRMNPYFEPNLVQLGEQARAK